MKKLILFLTVISLPTVFAADYKCTTEFGETIPVDLTIKGEKEPRSNWNPQIVHETLRAKLKEREENVSGKKAVFRTRYAHQKGPEFSFRLNCSAFDKCEMNFLSLAKTIIKEDKYELIIKAPRIYDERLRDNSGHAQIMIARRDHKGFIVRVFKDKVPVTETLVTQASSSGEIKIFSEDPRFSLDVGVDEQFQLGPEERIRLATLELKIECEKIP